MVMAELVAGRELDAVVAEKVVGHDVHLDPNIDGSKDVWREDGEQLRRYSTDIAAAWQVVERMRQNGWQFQATLWHDDKWHVQFWADLRPIYGEIDETAPLAICRAALAAVSH